MKLSKVVDISRAYQQLGACVQEQLVHVMADDMSPEDVTEAGLNDIMGWLDVVVNTTVHDKDVRQVARARIMVEFYVVQERIADYLGCLGEVL